MKTLTSLLTAAVLFSGVMVLAQGQNGRHQHRSELAERMKNRLSLTEEQYASITKADEGYRSKIETIRQDNKTDQQLKQAELRNLRKQRRDEIGKILTAEQKAEWKKIIEEKRNQKRAWKQDDLITEMKKTLSLTDEQVVKIKQLQGERNKKVRSEKVNGVSKAQTKEAHTTSRNEYRAAVKAILTPEQFAQWRSMKSDRRHDKAKSLHRKHYKK